MVFRGGPKFCVMSIVSQGLCCFSLHPDFYFHQNCAELKYLTLTNGMPRQISID